MANIVPTSSILIVFYDRDVFKVRIIVKNLVIDVLALLNVSFGCDNIL